MSLNFKYIPLTFLTDESEIKKQICNTIILRYFFDKNNSTVKLNDLIEGTQYGYNASALESGNNKFLRISDITNGKVDWETVPFCNCDDEETYLLYPDDILIARTGGTTGKSFLISSPPEHSIYAGYLIRIRANSETKPEFLKLFLDSYAYWSQIVSMNEDEFRPSVNANKLKQLLLPKCEPSEQEIAIKISTGEVISGYEDLRIQIDKAINEYENCKRIQEHCLIQKSNTEFLKQSILQEAIQGKLTEEWRKQNPDVEPASELLKRIKAEKEQLFNDKKIKKGKKQASNDLGEIQFDIPTTWLYSDLDDITQFTTDGTHQTPTYTETGRIFLSAQNVKPFKFMPENHRYISEQAYQEYTKGKLPEVGDLLIGRVGSKGETAVIDQDIEFAYYVSLGFVKTFKSLTNPDYLAIVMNSPYGNKYATGNMSSIGASAGNFNLGRIRSFPIPFPPLDEQLEIVNKVNDLMETVEALESEITQSEQHAQMLMQAVLKEAFEGKQEVVEV